MQPGQELEYDSNAYDMFHKMSLEWSCLSFDIIRDNLGVQRSVVRETPPFLSFLSMTRVLARAGAVPPHCLLYRWYSSRRREEQQTLCLEGVSALQNQAR